MANNKIKVIKRMAYGFRDDAYFFLKIRGAFRNSVKNQKKAVLGGFSIIEVSSRDEALMWAARIAHACRCAQEVREIMFDAES
jgi:Transposase